MENTIKFMLVFSCMLFSFLGTSWNRQDAKILRAAMLMTALADFYLLINRHIVLGLFFFCIVQLLYQYRYFSNAKIWFISGVWALIVTSLRLDLIFMLALCYMGFFIITFIGLFCIFCQKKNIPLNQWLAVTGMILLALCDIHVAILNWNLDLTAIRQQQLIFLIWSFYLPSQILLAFSSRKFLSSERHAPQLVSLKPVERTVKER